MLLMDLGVDCMMTGPEVKSLLEQGFQALFPGFLMSSARKQYAKLRIEREQCTVRDTCGYDTALSALNGCGSVIVQIPQQRIVLLTAGGAAGKNPSVAELVFFEDSVTITTWAKEGLIDQKTAQRALQDIRVLLGL